MEEEETEAEEREGDRQGDRDPEREGGEEIELSMVSLRWEMWGSRSKGMMKDSVEEASENQQRRL